MTERGHRLDSVLELVVDEDEVLRRLSSRRRLVDGEWVTRGDDRPETVRHRLQVHPEVTAPLSDLCAAAGLLRWVDAVGDVADVTGLALAALGSPQVSAG